MTTRASLWNTEPVYTSCNSSYILCVEDGFSGSISYCEQAWSEQPGPIHTGGMIPDTRNLKVCFGSRSPCTHRTGWQVEVLQAQVLAFVHNNPKVLHFLIQVAERIRIWFWFLILSLYGGQKMRGEKKASWTRHSLRRWSCSLESNWLEWQEIMLAC